MKPEQEIELLKQEIEYYKKMLQWYRDTYETRSLIGVVKEKISKKLKNSRKINGITRGTESLQQQHQFTETGAFELPKIDKSSFYAHHHTDVSLLKIGVFVHLFYQDLWSEINHYLQNMGINFDLLITVSQDDPGSDKTIADIKNSYPYAIILKVPNRGLDVGPFFELTNYVIKKGLTYDYVLKFHTKKSLGVDEKVGESWRKKCYESLMGSYTIVAHILRLFISDNRIGMIGPYETRMSQSVNDVQKGSNANAANIKKLAAQLHIKDQTLDFFGGTMFWVRWPIFEKKFRERTLSIQDFEPGYKKDELLSHGMERLFASIVRDAGYRLYEMGKINDYFFYKHQKKKICWIHPGYGIGGGNRVIFEICQEQMKYYDVYSISFMGHSFTNWVEVNHNILQFSNENEAHAFIQTIGIDYVFATGWQTVNFVNNLRTPAKKFYFIQDYEPWFADANTEIAKQTYNNHFAANIVIADWLKKKLLSEHNNPAKFVKLGTRLYDSKINQSVVKNNTCRVLFYYKLKTHIGRGSDLVYTLLDKLSGKQNLELHVFGHEDPGIKGVKFHGEVYKEGLLTLYQNADLFVDLSRHRGIATIALEAAQFGVVPLLSAETYGLKEYGFVHGANCLFVENADDAYAKILSLTSNRQQLQQLKEGIQSLSKTFQWKLTANDLNQIIDIF